MVGKSTYHKICVCVRALVCSVEKRIHGLISQSEWWLNIICGGVWCNVTLHYPTMAVVADISTGRGDMLTEVIAPSWGFITSICIHGEESK